MMEIFKSYPREEFSGDKQDTIQYFQEAQKKGT